MNQLNRSSHPPLSRAANSIPIRREVRRRGMSLIEAMIALAISTTLLVAVSAAYSASAKAVEMNDSYFHCSQATRVTMVQVLAELRRADAVQVAADYSYVQIIRPADELTQNGTQTETYRQFTFDSVNQRITLQIFYTGGLSSPVYELATNITAGVFGPADSGLDYNNTVVAVRVPVTITCSVQGNSVTLSGSAAPRRAQQF